MTTPTGTITLAQVNAEIGASPTANITLNDTAVRYLAATSTLSPSSPFLTANSNISLNDLRGRKATIFASGGTLVPTPTHNIHVFTSPGTFTVNYVFPTANTVEYVVVAGGGGGGRTINGGGGGAGGFRTGTGFPVTATSYPITIGAGGAGGTSPLSEPGKKGNDSIFSTITSTGGGYGSGISSPTAENGGPGGSGGGSRGVGGAGGVGNTPPVSPPQGNSGGSTPGPTIAAGGGGAGIMAMPVSTPLLVGGDGGYGSPVTWVPSSYGTSSPRGPGRWFAGGGGGGGPTVNGAGGDGGGGNAGNPAQAGTINTGGGGGGAGSGPPASNGGPGGSGIVIIRYPI